MIPPWLSSKLLQLEHVEKCGQWIDRDPLYPQLPYTGFESLGAGMIYYQLARTLKPRYTLVIGSLRGFAPICFARAHKENDKGKVVFIDAGLIDDFWQDPDRVKRHFDDFGVAEYIDHWHTNIDELNNITAISGIGLVLIDGHHSYDSAKRDFDFARQLTDEKCLYLFHDSCRNDQSTMYGQPYRVGVMRLMDQLRDGYEGHWQVLDLITDLPGLTLVRR